MTTNTKPHVGASDMGQMTTAASSGLCRPDTTSGRGSRQVLWDGEKHTCAIDPDSTLRKTVVGSEHMLRYPPAWAFSAAHVEAARANGVLRVEVFDKETGRVYRCPFAVFLAHGFSFDRKHGPQVGLVLRYWTVTGPGIAETEPPAARETQPVQLALL